MGALIVAETIFYIVVSLAIIILGVIFGMAIYELVRIAKNLRAISDNLSNISKDASDKLQELIQRLSESPILSFFIKKSPKADGTKGRNHK